MEQYWIFYVKTSSHYLTRNHQRYVFAEVARDAFDCLLGRVCKACDLYGEDRGFDSRRGCFLFFCIFCLPHVYSLHRLYNLNAFHITTFYWKAGSLKYMKYLSHGLGPTFNIVLAGLGLRLNSPFN